MPSPDDLRQPQDISKPLADYLGMTSSSRTRQPKRRPRSRDDDERIASHLIDNRGLGLDEGNDFA